MSKDESQDEASPCSVSIQDEHLPNALPQVVGEHVVVNCEGSWEIGEVAEVGSNGSVKVSFMKLKKVATADKSEHPRRFWVWPAKKELLVTEKENVLPLRPDLIVAKPPSTRRMIVFSVENAEILDKFS